MMNQNPRLGDMATMRDGTRLAYELVPGTGKGRLALIHSLAMDASFWSGVVDHLRKDADILIYDCRGHGKSDKPQGPYSVELFADDLADLFATIGWTKAAVAGASMGGCVALAFAAAHAEKVSGLGLIDTTAWYGADAPRAWEERAQKAIDEGLSGLIGFQITRWFSDAFRAANPQTTQDAVSVFLANDVRAYADTCRMLGRCDQRAALPRVAVPTRILVGEQDYATPPAMAEAMHKAIPHATLDIISGVRHLTPIECPDVVSKALREILVQ